MPMKTLLKNIYEHRRKNTMRLKNLVCSLGLALLLVGILAACTTAPETSTTANVPPTISSSSSSSSVVSVGQVPSHQAVGSTLTVLTTTKGFTLYIHEFQGASGFACDSSC